MPQLLNDLIAEQEPKELGFGDIGGQLDIIEAPLTKLVDHEWLVVLKDDRIHWSTPFATSLLHRWGLPR